MVEWQGQRFASCYPSQRPDELELSVDIVSIGNCEQALGHLSAIGTHSGLQDTTLGQIQAYRAGRGRGDSGPFCLGTGRPRRSPER